MGTTITGLNKVGYNYLNDLQGNDIGICEDLETTTNGYNFSEMISEIANNWTEIYNSELFKIGFELYSNGYCEDAENELGSEGIIGILQGAHFLYIQQLLYYNLDDVITNIAINYIDDNDLQISESEFAELESELESLDGNNNVSDVIDTVDEFLKDKINDMFENFDKKKFIDGMCDGMLSTISECLKYTFKVKEDNIDYLFFNEYDLEEKIEEYDLEDEYEEFCQSVVDDLYEEFKRLNSEYFVDIDGTEITVRNSPKIIVEELSDIINEELTVNDMDNRVGGTIEDEYEVDVYYGGFRGGDANEMIYENKSCSYQLGDDIWLNVVWDIVKVNEDYWKTIVKVSNVELI